MQKKLKNLQSDKDYELRVNLEEMVEELEKEFRKEKKQNCELSIEYDDMKAELEKLRRIEAEVEELKKWKAESYHEELKSLYEELQVDLKFAHPLKSIKK